MDWFEFFSGLFESGPFSYVVVFAFLILAGLGLPFPEEVIFLVAGFVVKKIDGNLGIMIGASLLGILAGDSVTFFMGRKFGNRLLGIWPFNKLLTQKNVDRSKEFFRKHGSKAIFIAGCMAGVRAPTFFLSATMGFSYWRFLLWDGARAVVTCPISVYLGYKFGEKAEEHLGPYKHYLFIGIGAIIAVLIIREILVHRRDLKESEHMAQTATADPSTQAAQETAAQAKPEQTPAKAD